MRVLTSPVTVAHEIDNIHFFFENGLEWLHVRKPGFSQPEMIAFLTALGQDFSNRLVLHNHHELAGYFGITRLHASKTLWNSPKETQIWSTSTHSMCEFNALQQVESAFLGPVHPSLSKPGYLPEANLFETLQERSNFSTKLVALGGISSENIAKTLRSGFDEVALLGTIWNGINPIENFKKCQQIALSC